MGIHELLQVTDELRELITRRAPEHEIRMAARAGGMRTLLEDGIAKAAQGLTTLEAVLKVAVPDDAPSAEGVPDNNAAPTDPGPNDVSRENGRAQVLIVEDDRTITAVVKYFLELEGFEVVIATDGLVGLETAKRHPPQAIVTDVNMPGMDGMAMVKALRADVRTHDIPILMLTSEGSVDSETLALSLGADDYILKPVEPRRLAARVKALLARSKTRNS
jgi:PleD family two-component response regulator